MTEATKIIPRAWLCELAQEDGSTRTQIVERDPTGLRWNDEGEPSPYRTTPLYDQAALEAAVAQERGRIINALPGGYIVDPQWVADMVRGNHAGRTT